jgi:hypothetical protein
MASGQSNLGHIRYPCHIHVHVCVHVRDHVYVHVHVNIHILRFRYTLKKLVLHSEVHKEADRPIW